MSKEGIYVAKKIINSQNTNQDDWIQIPRSKQNKKKKKTYSYEDNLRKKLERKKKNYLYKINRNKKELEKFVQENSLFIKSRLEEGYTIIDINLKNDINNNLDIFENKYELANSTDNLREFLALSKEVKEAINNINLKINKTNFTGLILDNKITNKNEALIDKIKSRVVTKKLNEKYGKIEPKFILC